MRGLYTASYLSFLCEAFARKRQVAALDLGGAFNLIVGTSTGAIIGCALAAGVAPSRIASLYRQHGTAIFEKPLPTGWSLVRSLPRLLSRPAALARGTEALRSALRENFGDITLGEVYSKRGIAMAINAIDMTQHRSWVFKTAHLESSHGRDDKCTLVDVCLATSAAPVYRSLAAIANNDCAGGHKVFADGGLWANNPVLVALVEALAMTNKDDRIEIFCLGTCPRPSGEIIPLGNIHRGVAEWQFGGAAAALAVDAQEFAFDEMARMLRKHVSRDCNIVRFPRDKVPASMMQYLDLDETRAEALDALENQARTDKDVTWSRCARQGDSEAALIASLFMSAPEADAAAMPSKQTA
jgi:hypothetical protein